MPKTRRTIPDGRPGSGPERVQLVAIVGLWTPETSGNGRSPSQGRDLSPLSRRSEAEVPARRAAV